MRFRLAAFSLVVALLASCVTRYPVREVRPDERLDPLHDEAGLWRVVERDEHRVRASGAVIRDPELQEYLGSVLCATVPEYCGDIRIYVVPSHQPSTTMSPNGMMLVDTGLLLRLGNEAQLAAMLGHEVAHYVKRHSLSQLRAARSNSNRVGTIDTVIGTGINLSDMVIGGSGNGLQFMLLANAVRAGAFVLRTGVHAVHDGGLHRYSMEQEVEADRAALSWMAHAGYAPEEAIAVWRLMQSEREAHPHSTGSPGRKNVRYASEESIVILDLTPSPKGANIPKQPSPLHAHRDRSVRSLKEILISETPDNMGKRADAAAMHANNLRRDHGHANRIGAAEYMRQIEPFRHEWLLHARGGLPIELEAVLLRRQREIGAHPGLALFHEAQMIRRRDDEGDGALAVETFREALAAREHPPETHRELGFALWDLGQAGAARQAFGRYLANHPNAPDRAMIRHHIDELGD